MDKELQKKIIKANHTALFKAIKKTKLPYSAVAEMLSVSPQQVDKFKKDTWDFKKSTYDYYSSILNINKAELEDVINQIVEEHNATRTPN